jgi:hypothetical protein
VATISRLRKVIHADTLDLLRTMEKKVSAPGWVRLENKMEDDMTVDFEQRQGVTVEDITFDKLAVAGGSPHGRYFVHIQIGNMRLTLTEREFERFAHRIEEVRTTNN